MLEHVASRDDVDSSASKGLTFGFGSTQEICQAQARPDDWLSSMQLATLISSRIVFPSYSAAVLLLDSYERSVDYVCHVLHLPSTRAMMRTAYLRLGRQETIAPGQAAVLLAVFAFSVYFYEAAPASEVATGERDALALCRHWSKGAMDILDYSQRHSTGSLEDVQACVIMSYVTYYLEGMSKKGRMLMASAVAIARDLRLNRLDAEDDVVHKDDERTAQAVICQEVKRRIFWHLVATDWLQSTVSGPQEGMYFIHPHHIHVKLPKNCDHEFLAFDEIGTTGSESRPTSMTFFLAKLRLAHICREITDTIPLETAKLMRTPYENIIAVDQKLKAFLSDLPFFLQLNPESRTRSRSLETVYDKVPLMRFLLLTTAHSRRCRLHQKFLLRLSSDARYTYSRRACLESARAIIRAFDDSARRSDSPSIPTAIARMASAVHYTHLALTVMVMDLCFNKGEDDMEERKQEVRAAMKMLEGVREASPLTDRSLHSLRQILHKSNIELGGPIMAPIDNVSNTVQISQPGAETVLSNDGSPQLPPGLTVGDWNEAFTSLSNSWTLTDQELSLGSATWDDIFSALNSRPF
ncbi:hypothetical protein PFICI_05429 [Pestalotiopsis fici W106-1]|uniref:Xylanolytic transcriptional activator regulatory domain-containing protein n=1 Tax=Pestalotiopsis fici (strain W106-1 / CGMCC3.15140) TaxID=1229662 RepID=W3XBT8_PESFW|nr:uncharacterized protein PFICI_05429 [Pestalotiopsis fici W106-1]ETS83553.1 hypothetical protein PFICI_05429 [Pestalotiopsis fici W106-1]